MQGYVEGVAGKLVESPLTPDGFLKTGDIGYANDQGYLFIADRAKEMIKVKGYAICRVFLQFFVFC